MYCHESYIYLTKFSRKVSLNADEISIAHALRPGKLPQLLYIFCICNTEMWFWRPSWLKGFRNLSDQPIFIHEKLAKTVVEIEKKHVKWIFNLKFASRGFGCSMEKSTKQLTTRVNCQSTPKSNQEPLQSRLVLHIAIAAKEILSFPQLVWLMTAMFMSIQLQRNKMWNSPQAHRPARVPKKEPTNQKLSATRLLLKVRSLNKHPDDLQVFLKTLESLPRVICFVETWIKDGNYENHFYLMNTKAY